MIRIQTWKICILPWTGPHGLETCFDRLEAWLTFLKWLETWVLHQVAWDLSALHITIHWMLYSNDALEKKFSVTDATPCFVLHQQKLHIGPGLTGWTRSSWLFRPPTPSSSAVPQPETQRRPSTGWRTAKSSRESRGWEASRWENLTPNTLTCKGNRSRAVI